MTNYEELVKALRGLANGIWKNSEYTWFGGEEKVFAEAAAAIEALNRLVDLNTQRCEALRKQLREAHESYERHLNDLEAQLPKRGEWVCADDDFNIWTCSICGLDFQLNEGTPKENNMAYCPSCGAKMEVQNER